MASLCCWVIDVLPPQSRQLLLICLVLTVHLIYHCLLLMSPLLLAFLAIVLAAHASAEVTAYSSALETLAVLFDASTLFAVTSHLVSRLFITCDLRLKRHWVLFQYNSYRIFTAGLEFRDIAAVIAATAHTVALGCEAFAVHFETLRAGAVATIRVH